MNKLMTLIGYGVVIFFGVFVLFPWTLLFILVEMGAI